MVIFFLQHTLKWDHVIVVLNARVSNLHLEEIMERNRWWHTYTPGYASNDSVSLRLEAIKRINNIFNYNIFLAWFVGIILANTFIRNSKLCGMRYRFDFSFFFFFFFNKRLQYFTILSRYFLILVLLFLCYGLMSVCRYYWCISTNHFQLGRYI